MTGWMGAVLPLWLGCRVLGAAVPNYFVHVWQTDEGLPQNGVSAIVQTLDGYLWVGTYSGLARFDGLQFRVFDNINTPEMYSSRVTSLYADASGGLWIGYETGGLIHYQDGRFESVDTGPEWSGRKILAIGADGAGDIWALGLDGSMVRSWNRRPTRWPIWVHWCGIGTG